VASDGAVIATTTDRDEIERDRRFADVFRSGDRDAIVTALGDRDGGPGIEAAG
jgi:hypothetical protein